MRVLLHQGAELRIHDPSEALGHGRRVAQAEGDQVHAEDINAPFLFIKRYFDIFLGLAPSDMTGCDWPKAGGPLSRERCR